MCLLKETYILCIVFISAREYLTGCFNIKMGDFSPCFSPQRFPVYPTATTTCEVLLSAEADQLRMLFNNNMQSYRLL